MHRYIFDDLMQWKSRQRRKPLIIRGARQVGKTFIVRQFAQEAFEDILEVNFDKQPELNDVFDKKNVDKTLQVLSTLFDVPIVAGKTLLFFDEIQAAPNVLPFLRYLYEEKPDLHVVAAGSLLEFLLSEHSFSMPVGRIEYFFMGPMSFEEFLLALGKDRLLGFLREFSLGDDLPGPIHEELVHLTRLYCVIGGMPAAVSAYVHSRDIDEALREHSSITNTYEDDFAKYGKRINYQRLRRVLAKLPILVGKRLKYSKLGLEARARELSADVHLLELARVIYRVCHSAGNGPPLGAEKKEKDFKLLFLDVGILATSLGLRLPEVINKNALMSVHAGSVAEQFIGQHLLYAGPIYQKPCLYYWNRPVPNSSAEIDYLLEHGAKIVPVEVKAGKSGRLRSLHQFMSEKSESEIALRFNVQAPSVLKEQGWILLSLPLYLVGQAIRLLNEVGS